MGTLARSMLVGLDGQKCPSYVCDDVMLESIKWIANPPVWRHDQRDAWQEPNAWIDYVRLES